MRYEIGEKLYGVHFLTEKFADDEFSKQWYSQPYMYSDDPVVKITIVELLVKEHHKVAWEYDEAKELKHDGYLLQDKEGFQWANQYPRASYGQLSTISDSRFTLYHPSPAEYDKLAKQGRMLECHLLTDFIGNVYRFLDKAESQTEAPVLYERLTKLINDIKIELQKLNLEFCREQVSLGELETDRKFTVFKIVEITNDNQRST